MKSPATQVVYGSATSASSAVKSSGLSPLERQWQMNELRRPCPQEGGYSAACRQRTSAETAIAVPQGWW